MEFSGTLGRGLEALDEDLDVLLDVDVSILSQSPMVDCANLMMINREQLPSQIYSELNASESSSQLNKLMEDDGTQRINLSLPQSQLAAKSVESSSLLMTSQEIDEIVLNDTEAHCGSVAGPVRDFQFPVPPVVSRSSGMLEFPHPSGQIKKEVLDLSSNPGTPNSQRLESSFEREYAKYQDDDFDLPLLDVDFEELKVFDRAHTKPSNAATTGGQVEKISKDQTHAPEPQRLLSKISSSCPDPTTSHKAALIHNPRSQPALAQTNVPRDENMEEQSSSSPTETPINIPESQPNAVPNNLDPCLLNEINRFNADATMIPPSVKQLYDVIKTQYSDFSFVYALSAQLCQDRMPMNCFVNLKMGLLLSLASISNNLNVPPIPIIAFGNDTSIINDLMTQVGQLAERFIGPSFYVKRPPKRGNVNWIAADPVILATKGVLYIGDWSCQKAACADKMFKNLENSCVAIEKLNESYPLETAVWAHWQSFKYNAKDQKAFNKFVKIFGIPIYVDDDNNEVLVDYLLEQSSVNLLPSSVDHLSISTDDMRKFLSVISKRTVDLTRKASTLLQKYFVASRVERPECLTKQAFSILKQFAESFAKLALRHEVLPIDAIASIFMCQNFIQRIYGSTENPSPIFESHNFIGLVDTHLETFQNWLDAYIKKFHDRQ